MILSVGHCQYSQHHVKIQKRREIARKKCLEIVKPRSNWTIYL